jgi:5'-deoxynucleotidase YfbR-like HD superfamily hydrolase
MTVSEAKQEKMDQGYGGYIATYTGGQIAPLNPDPADINIEDVAHSLANQCRFTGHTRVFYSVAQHSTLVSELCPDKYRLWGLLHDATEAYLSDIARPIKRFSGTFGEIYSEVEDNLMKAVIERFGLEYVLPMPDAVKEADNILLANEIRHLMADSPLYAGWEDYPEIRTGALSYRSPVVAKQMFLNMFNELGGK